MCPRHYEAHKSACHLPAEMRCGYRPPGDPASPAWNVGVVCVEGHCGKLLENVGRNATGVPDRAGRDGFECTVEDGLTECGVVTCFDCAGACPCGASMCQPCARFRECFWCPERR